MTHSCGLCNKSYTRKTSYDRHVILCEILHQSKREKKCKGQELSDIPSHTQLFLIVQELALKNQILETKMIEMQKWVETKKKKLNVKRKRIVEIDGVQTVVEEKKKLIIPIEKGMKGEQKIRFEGEADQIPGYKPGDIIINLIENNI